MQHFQIESYHHLIARERFPRKLRKANSTVASKTGTGKPKHAALFHGFVEKVDSDSPHLKQQRRLLRERICMHILGGIVIFGLFVACALIVLVHPCHHHSGIAVDAAIRASSNTAHATDPRWGWGAAGSRVSIDGYRLPPADRQTWAHATCSREDVEKALADDKVTAIEADVVMGRIVKKGEESHHTSTSHESSPKFAIMAHPPAITGDLTVRDFLEMVSYPVGDQAMGSDGSKRTIRRRRALRKHIKLDFKALATVTPAMDALIDLGIMPDGLGSDEESRHTLNEGITERGEQTNEGGHGWNGRNLVGSVKSSGGKTLFLNANVLAGPGHRWGPQDEWLDGDAFLNACLDHDALRGGMNGKSLSGTADGYAFSLGYVTDNSALQGFSKSDVEAMINLVKKHDLTGVVLAVNARILAIDPAPFDIFFREVPSSQLLAWTAKHLLPISRRKVEFIKSHFRHSGTVNRVGFDVEIAESFLSGIIYDVLYSITFALLLLLKIIVSWFYMVNGRVC